MGVLLNFLTAHWFPAVLLAVALALLAALRLLRHRPIRWFTPLLVGSSALAVASVGGLALPPRWAGWFLVGDAALFVVVFLVLVFTGAWWRCLGYGIVILALLGTGGLW